MQSHVRRREPAAWQRKAERHETLTYARTSAPSLCPRSPPVRDRSPVPEAYYRDTPY